MMTVDQMLDFDHDAPENLPLSEILREARIATGLTQEDLALQIGVHRKTWSSFECQARPGSIGRPKIIDACEILGLDPSFVLWKLRILPDHVEGTLLENYALFKVILNAVEKSDR